MRTVMATLLLVAGAQASLAHGDWPPKHGGQMSDGETSFELVVHQRRLTLHLEDHGTPIPTTGAQGTVTITTSGKEQVQALQPAGGNRLQTAVESHLPVLSRGDRLVARVTLGNGSVVVGRFVLP